MSVLSVNNITLRYGQLTALQDISFDLHEGEILFVTGPNGAGKSSLLKAIAGLQPICQGSIALHGQTIGRWPPEKVARSGFSMVPEGRHVFSALTIEENLLVGAGLNANTPTGEALERVYESFPILRERRYSGAGLLSGGQQQMLVIARALMTESPFIAIDEPSLGLAPKIIDQVYDLLLKIKQERHLTLLIVEQNSSRAVDIGGRMLLLRNGQIQMQGDARELGSSSALNDAYFGYGE